jgi:hypothetical protein
VFRKVGLFQSSWDTCTLLVSLERASLNHWTPELVTEVSSFYQTEKRRCLPPVRLRTEANPVSEMLCSLEYRTMDKVQEPSNTKCYYNRRQNPLESIRSTYFNMKEREEGRGMALRRKWKWNVRNSKEGKEVRVPKVIWTSCWIFSGH